MKRTVATWLASHTDPTVTLYQVALHALGLPEQDHKQPTMVKLGIIMRRLDWKKERLPGSHNHTLYVYRRPPVEVLPPPPPPLERLPPLSEIQEHALEATKAPEGATLDVYHSSVMKALLAKGLVAVDNSNPNQAVYRSTLKGNAYHVGLYKLSPHHLALIVTRQRRDGATRTYQNLHVSENTLTNALNIGVKWETYQKILRNLGCVS